MVDLAAKYLRIATALGPLANLVFAMLDMLEVRLITIEPI